MRTFIDGKPTHRRLFLFAIATVCLIGRTGASAPGGAVTFYQAAADYKAGRLDAAIKEYNQLIALQLRPQDASIAVMRRGNCYYGKHDLERAIADFDQAIRLDPKNGAAYDNRANALDARGDRDGALRDYTSALRLNPQNSYAYVNRGSLRMEQGDFTGALADYGTALRINPRERIAHTGRAQIYVLQRNPEQALKEANAAISLAPGETEGYTSRARAYMELRRYADAEADIEHAMQLKHWDPTSALGLFAWFRATCPDSHFRNGKQALEAAQRDCRSGKFFAFACLDTLAAAYAEVGDFDDAVKYQTQAVENAPPHFPLLSQTKQRLELYKQHKPYRDGPGEVSWH